MNKFDIFYICCAMVAVVTLAAIINYYLIENEIYLFGDLVDCPNELNTSNFTQNIWDKYCMETKTDADYNGTANLTK